MDTPQVFLAFIGHILPGHKLTRLAVGMIEDEAKEHCQVGTSIYSQAVVQLQTSPGEREGTAKAGC